MSPLHSSSTAGAARARRLRRPSKVTPARWAAWLTVRRTFDEDAWTDRAFTAVVEQLGLDDDPRERAFAQRLAFGTVQQAKRLDHVIGVLGKRPLRKIDPPVLHALRIGVHELLDLQQQGGGLGSSSAHAAVSQAVELVRGVVGERAVAFTNAILRRAQVDGARILAQLDPQDDEDLAVLLSMPQWLVQRARAGHGALGIEALRAQNEPTPSTTFRVNRAHPDAATRYPDADELGVVTVEGSTAGLAEDVAAGMLVPQSRASQLVTLALDPQPGDRVLDMCAAPGGKSTHIASRLEGRGAVLAVELHEHRAESIRVLARRTRTEDLLEVQVGDATALDPAQVGTFDRVLVDAPCTGTGVLSGRPDARWKRTEEGLAELTGLQLQLLASAAQLVRPGGTVVYSTCSILREEDESVVGDLPATLQPGTLPPALQPFATSGHTARTWPHRDGTDGFFIAVLRRREDGPEGSAA